jgi:hypothetical protein
MLPAESTLALPIQRWVASGAKVPCWKIVGVPALIRSSYQRMPAMPVPVASTVWVKTSASWSPNLR